MIFPPKIYSFIHVPYLNKYTFKCSGCQENDTPLLFPGQNQGLGLAKLVTPSWTERASQAAGFTTGAELPH